MHEVCGELYMLVLFFFFSSRRRHTRFDCDWSSDVCSSDLEHQVIQNAREAAGCPFDDEAPNQRRKQDCHNTGLRTGVPKRDRKSTRLNSSHSQISYAVFCLKKKKNKKYTIMKYKKKHMYYN